MSTYVYYLSTICRLISGYYILTDMSTICRLYVYYYVYFMSTICRLFVLYVDYMSTICRLYVDYILCLLMSICQTICRLMSTICLLYVNLCRLMSTICRLYVYFMSTLLCIKVCNFVILALLLLVGVVMDYKAAPTESAPISSPTHTYQCRRLWKLDKLCNHGVIRCIVCREEYKHKDIPCIHNINEIEEALRRIGQTLE